LLTSTGEKAAAIDLASAVTRMLKAFRVRGDAAVVTEEYLGVLWSPGIDVDDAIKAMDRFSRNVVPGHNNNFEPKPVQVIEEIDRVNNMFVTPGRPEARIALAAPVAAPRTDAEREKADEILRAAGFGPKGAKGAPMGEESDAERQRRIEQMNRDAEAREANRRRIAQEWADRGEEPMYADDARTMLISPALADILRAQRDMEAAGFGNEPDELELRTGERRR
jgi:hypothetical protein